MPLEISKLRTLLEYEPETGFFVKNGRRTQGYSNGVRFMLTVCGKTYPAARIAWALYYGEWPARELHVDHINRDPKDNRLTNLRLATVAENMRNRREQAINKCGRKGVWYEAVRNKWVATIAVDGKNREVGSYATADEASEAYKQASLAVQKDFSIYANGQPVGEVQFPAKPPKDVARGERHGSAKLDWVKVRAMRSLYASGYSVPTLTRLYGVDRETIRKALKNQTWIEKRAADALEKLP